jgi:hypothetical protein
MTEGRPSVAVMKSSIPPEINGLAMEPVAELDIHRNAAPLQA